MFLIEKAHIEISNYLNPPTWQMRLLSLLFGALALSSVLFIL